MGPSSLILSDFHDRIQVMFKKNGCRLQGNPSKRHVEGGRFMQYTHRSPGLSQPKCLWEAGNLCPPLLPLSDGRSKDGGRSRIPFELILAA